MPWELNGNAGTNPPNDYLGTQDRRPLVIKASGVEAMRVVPHPPMLTTDGQQPGGYLGIGTTAPQHRLHVLGLGGREVVARFEQAPRAVTQVDLVSTQGFANYGSFIRFVDSGVVNAAIKSTANGQLRFATNPPDQPQEQPPDRVTIASDGTVHVEMDVVLTSDARLKADIEPVGDAAAGIERIRGVKFSRVSPVGSSADSPIGRSIGVVAQEVETVFPELVRSSEGGGYKAVNYSGLVGVLIEAVKEVIAENRELRRRIESLEAAVS